VAAVQQLCFLYQFLLSAGDMVPQTKTLCLVENFTAQYKLYADTIYKVTAL
jgi:hypothetical protein